ncbi:MAG: fumarylacetoacetate hydrolase family protein [Armatimonadetes bacterium]|nr:fumarylacetoacetate hydrolase family protein [Armatimonadota bacterium]
MKFVCYKEFDDPQEPVRPGLLYKNKTLPLGRVIAVAEAFHPRGLAVPEDWNALVARLPAFAEAVKELTQGKALDQVWPEVGVLPAAPVPRPNRILAIGRNYAEHAKEQDSDVPDEPIVFQKASTSVIGPGQPIVIPPHIGRVDFEGELAVVIGRSGRNVPEAEALSLVAGYTLMNDVTARDEQRRAFARSLPWFLSKSRDTFGPMGPCLVTADEIVDPHKLQLTTTVNGEVKQQAGTSEMIFSIPQLIAFLSRHMALEPGDVIPTGTPSGIGPLRPGDTVEMHIPEIGTLSNPVIGEEEWGGEEAE